MSDTLFVRILLAALFSGAALYGCTKGKKAREGQAEEVTSPQVEVQVPSAAEEPIKKELEDLLDRSKPIKEFTPEVFVALTIKHRKETKRWVEESKNLSEQEQKKYIENANRAFFSSYGTNEEAFIQYPQSHMEALNSYINEHPELMKDLAIED
jgi:hypothetical protein